MSSREQLIAYLATLVTLALIVIAGLSFAAFNGGIMGKIEAFGLGTAVGGLIGLLRAPVGRRTPGGDE